MFGLFNAKGRIDHHTYSKIVVMTGGGGILGRALLESKPKDVLFVNISRRHALSGPGIISLKADLRKSRVKLLIDLKRLLPRIDVLIHGAYDNNFASISNFTLDAFLKEVALDAAIPVLFTKEIADIFWYKNQVENEHDPKVIYISSGASRGKTNREELATYGASKAALNILMEYMHEYLNSYGVSVHGLAPGSLKDIVIREKVKEQFWSRVFDHEKKYTFDILQ